MGRIVDFYNKYDCLIIIFTICLGTLIFLWGLTYGLYKYNVEIAQANVVKVYIKSLVLIETNIGTFGNEEEKLIYEGKQAFISIQSGGMTTTVTIYKKLYPILVIDKTYSDKTIRVEGE